MAFNKRDFDGTGVSIAHAPALLEALENLSVGGVLLAKLSAPNATGGASSTTVSLQFVDQDGAPTQSSILFEMAV